MTLEVEVVISDRADADLGDAYRYIAGFMGTGRAQDWVEDFYLRLYELAIVPGPYANVRDELASTFAGRETRRFLYRGSRKRPTKSVYKAYYFVPPPAEGEGSFIHGSSNWPTEAASNESEP
ncbi:MAG: hypothetical protein H8F28_27690 [Fibrella sp.]|nr:hypothetical protein [Armatimonadota bacterium]